MLLLICLQCLVTCSENIWQNALLWTCGLCLWKTKVRRRRTGLNHRFTSAAGSTCSFGEMSIWGLSVCRTHCRNCRLWLTVDAQWSNGDQNVDPLLTGELFRQVVPKSGGTENKNKWLPLSAAWTELNWKQIKMWLQLPWQAKSTSGWCYKEIRAWIA